MIGQAISIVIFETADILYVFNTIQLDTATYVANNNYILTPKFLL